jgi:alpha-L-fucosidase 2
LKLASEVWGFDALEDSITCTLIASKWNANPLRKAIRRVKSTVDSSVNYRDSGEFKPRLDSQPVPWVQIPNAKLQAQYELCTYLYRASIAPSAPALSLQGLWTTDEGNLPPWKGDYHNDLNTQFVYTPYLTGNLREVGRSWVSFNLSLLPRYERFATEFYGMPSVCAAIPGVMAVNGDPLGGWGQYSLSPTNGAWIAWQIYRDWKCEHRPRDVGLPVYMFCARVCSGILAIMKPTQESLGKLRLPLSTSPEIHDNSYKAWLKPNSNYDLALLRALVAGMADMADGVGRQSEVPQWNAMLEQLEELDTQDGALTFARGEPYAESHRHLSHAMAIHPLGLLSIHGSDQDRTIINATLDQIEEKGTQNWVGYTFAWFSAMCARAGRSEQAFDYLEKFLNFVGPNGFHLNGDQSGTGLSKFTYRPFTLEGNFMAMDAIHQMLLNSDGGVIRVFPAVSNRWQDVEFRNLRIERDVLVSARRYKGRTIQVRLLRPFGWPTRVLNPFRGTLKPNETLDMGNTEGLDPEAEYWDLGQTGFDSFTAAIKERSR